MANLHANESDVSPFTKNMIKSDDPIVQQEQYDLVNASKGRCERIITVWNIFDESARPPFWRPKLGFCLTFVYLVGIIIITSLYFKYSFSDGRPTIVRSEFASHESIGLMNDYVCSCNLPPQIQDDAGNDTRSKTFNHCYELNEVRDLDVLQFSEELVVRDIVELYNENPFSSRTFNNGYSLNWESYELLTSGNPFNSSDVGNPLANLTNQMTELGFIGENGFITVSSLASQAFFTVPSGFIKANVTYNCTSCDACEVIWKEYSLTNGIRRVPRSNLTKDIGWIICSESSRVPGRTPECQGSCRFFRTQFEPWGIAMHMFAKMLVDQHVVEDAENTLVFFQSRLLYANISQYSHRDHYEMSFFEIERTSTSWARLLDFFPIIPECSENKDKVVICNGTSICESASVYSSVAINSETLQVVCMNYPTGADFDIDQEQCNDIVKNLSITTQNDTKLALVCENFQCLEVQSSQVALDNYRYLQGEVALSRLIWTPSFKTSFIPAVCSNNFSQVVVRYKEGPGEQKGNKEILSIFQTQCSRGRAEGCWLTGHYKNVTDMMNEPWKSYNFTEEEILSAETMFVCYRFAKKSYYSYLYDRIGILAGIIGSWLLTISCIFWIATRILSAHPPPVGSCRHCHPPNQPPSFSWLAAGGRELSRRRRSPGSSTYV